MQTNYESALALARERWAVHNAFDLEDQCWIGLFQEYGCPTVIEAIKGLRNFRDDRPSARFQTFQNAIARIASGSGPSSRVQ